jgi:hypothetical protein
LVSLPSLLLALLSIKKLNHAPSFDVCRATALATHHADQDHKGLKNDDFYAENCVIFVLYIERKQHSLSLMESLNTAFIAPALSVSKPLRSSRRKVNGEVTAALLIQMASEILASSPTLRKRLNISLNDLSAAEKVRRELNRRAPVIH